MPVNDRHLLPIERSFGIFHQQRERSHLLDMSKEGIQLPLQTRYSVNSTVECASICHDQDILSQLLQAHIFTLTQLNHNSHLLLQCELIFHETNHDMAPDQMSSSVERRTMSGI